MDTELKEVLIKEIMECLEKDEPTTYTLILNKELLGEDGIHQILDALIVHPNVYSCIHYRYEDGGDGEGVKLAAALKASTTLAELAIDGNKFSHVTAAAFIDALGANTTLDLLNITNSFSRDAEKEIFRAIRFVHANRQRLSRTA